MTAKPPGHFCTRTFIKELRILFALFFLMQLLNDFLANVPAMADRENANHSGFAIGVIDDAKPPDSEPAKSGQFADER